MLLFVFRQDKAQPEYFSFALLVYGFTTVPVELNPGSVEQLLEVWTLPSIWIPITSSIAIAMNAPTSPIMVLDSAMLIFGLVF